MLKFAPNLSMLFTEVPFIDRFRRAGEVGFRAVEYQFAQAATTDEIRAELDRYGLTLALTNLDAGDFAGGDRGYLNDPRQRDRFMRSVEEGVAMAKRLGCTRLNAMAGNRLPDVPEEAQWECIVENLKRAGPLAAAEGVTLLIEALNRYDAPRYILTHSAPGFDVLAKVNLPNVKFQYDVYHMQRMEGSLVDTMTGHTREIGHIQIADLPGRHEPGTGEINFPFIFGALEKAGYQGHIGLEYKPLAGTDASFGWLPEAARARGC